MSFKVKKFGINVNIVLPYRGMLYFERATLKQDSFEMTYDIGLYDQESKQYYLYDNHEIILEEKTAEKIRLNFIPLELINVINNSKTCNNGDIGITRFDKDGEKAFLVDSKDPKIRNILFRMFKEAVPYRDDSYLTGLMNYI